MYIADPLPSDERGAGRATLEEHVSRIARPVEVSSARLLVVDQVEALADLHGATLRRTFAALAGVAQRTGAAVLALCHNPATTLPGAVDAMARRSLSAICVLTIASVGPESQRVLVPVNPSMSGGALALPFRFAQNSLVWDAPVSHAGLDAIGRFPDSENRAAKAGPLREAIDLLDAMLNEGPRPATEVTHAAIARRISRYQLFEARKFRHVRSVRVGTRGKGQGKGAWYWHLEHNGFRVAIPPSPALRPLTQQPDDGLAA